MELVSARRGGLAALLLLLAAPVSAQVWGDHEVRCLRVSDDNGSNENCICRDSNGALFHDDDCDNVRDVALADDPDGGGPWVSPRQLMEAWRGVVYTRQSYFGPGDANNLNCDDPTWGITCDESTLGSLCYGYTGDTMGVCAHSHLGYSWNIIGGFGVIPTAGGPPTNDVDLAAPTAGFSGQFMQTDAKLRLSQSIAPSWTANHNWIDDVQVQLGTAGEWLLYYDSASDTNVLWSNVRSGGSDTATYGDNALHALYDLNGNFPANDANAAVALLDGAVGGVQFFVRDGSDVDHKWLELAPWGRWFDGNSAAQPGLMFYNDELTPGSHPWENGWAIGGWNVAAQTFSGIRKQQYDYITNFIDDDVTAFSTASWGLDLGGTVYSQLQTAYNFRLNIAHIVGNNQSVGRAHNRHDDNDLSGPLFTFYQYRNDTYGSPVHDGPADNVDYFQDTTLTGGQQFSNDQLIGMTINNTTDGSSGIVTRNTNTIIYSRNIDCASSGYTDAGRRASCCTGLDAGTCGLSGGTDNDWDVGDAMTVPAWDDEILFTVWADQDWQDGTAVSSDAVSGAGIAGDSHFTFDDEAMDTQGDTFLTYDTVDSQLELWVDAVERLVVDGNGLELEGYVELTDAAAPGNPAAGTTRCYSKTGSSGDLCCRDSAGTETCMSSGSGGGGSASGAPNYSQSFTSQTTVTLTHNLGTKNLLVMCYDSTDIYIGPDSFDIDAADPWDIVVDFSSAQTGRCVVNGLMNAARYTTTFTAQTSVTVTGATHGVGTNMLSVTCYDDADPRNMVEPDSWTSDDGTNDVVISFFEAETGKCVLQ